MEEILLDSRASYENYIKNLPNGCEIIVNYLREDRILDAGNLIAQFAEGLIWLIDMNKLLVPYEMVIALREEKLLEFLNEVNQGLENQDFILIADMFEYEIKPFFENHLESMKDKN